MTTKRIPVDDVVFDQTIYPRAKWSKAIVNKYVEGLEAGNVFPQIILEEDTNRLLDGKHRLEAHRKLGRPIEAEWHKVPDGMPAKLYAASLSAKHGHRIDYAELKAIARETVSNDENYSLQILAERLGVRLDTVGKWTSDIRAAQRERKIVKASLLSWAGWSTRNIGKHLGVNNQTVSNFSGTGIFRQASEDQLRAAGRDLGGVIDVDKVVSEIIAERRAQEEAAQAEREAQEQASAEFWAKQWNGEGTTTRPPAQEQTPETSATIPKVTADDVAEMQRRKPLSEMKVKLAKSNSFIGETLEIYQGLTFEFSEDEKAVLRAFTSKIIEKIVVLDSKLDAEYNRTVNGDNT